jgi:hypothetical protein
MIKAIETPYKGYRFRSRLEARWAVFFDALGIRWEYEKEGYDLGDAGWYLPDFWLPQQNVWIEIKGATPTHEEQTRCHLLADGTGYPVVLLSGAIDGKNEPHIGWVPFFSIRVFFGYHKPLHALHSMAAYCYGHNFDASQDDCEIDTTLAGHLTRNWEADQVKLFLEEGILLREKVVGLINLDREYYKYTYGREHPSWQYGISHKANVINCHEGYLSFDDCAGVGIHDRAVLDAIAAARAARFEHGETPR